MSFFNRQSRLRKLINISELLELNIDDDNIKSCIIAVFMCEDIHDNNLEVALMATYRSQPTVFITALNNTREFQHILNLLNFEISSPHYEKVM
ncbi:hypothetical protein EDI28_08375 [Photobacterium chitinilyticum]|uniref:Uncharacterized protein n=1 Tax=Photobacterium chitinilyticum TaxID=2485123 RepID=A0A3S3RII6_9GAMM|nr:hypothetical protein EDI28_08375 [Photobacterium chitinilyticum]